MTMNSKEVRIWKVVVMGCLKILSQQSLGKTKEQHTSLRTAGN
jgi:hypothetical protein